MELKDIVEMLIDYAKECLIFLLFIAILWELVIEGGIGSLVQALESGILAG